MVSGTRNLKGVGRYVNENRIIITRRQVQRLSKKLDWTALSHSEDVPLST